MKVSKSAISCTLMPASSPSGMRLLPDEELPLTFARGSVTSAMVQEGDCLLRPAPLVPRYGAAKWTAV